MSRVGLLALVLALLPAAAICYEGRRCALTDGSLGECRVVKNCPQAQGKRLSNFKICGFVGKDSLICCPEISSTTTEKTESPTIDDGGDIIFKSDEEILDEYQLTSTTIASRLPDISKIKRISEIVCENLTVEVPFLLDYHILNGEAAEPGEFPHMVAIGFTKDTGIEYDCGGTLISQNYVLTAAHCTNRNTPSVVKLGEVDLKNAESTALDIEVESVIVHPDYKRKHNYHDLALLKLKTDVSYTAEIHPACLHTSMEDVKTKLIISGWGNTNATKELRSNVLLKANVGMVDIQTCNKTYTQPKLLRVPQGIMAGQMCAVDDQSDTCQGDSGGPLQISHQRDNLYILVGVTSFGKNCGSQIPAVYTRVAYYLDWIESVVWPPK